jgi:hypothetical protein
MRGNVADLACKLVGILTPEIICLNARNSGKANVAWALLLEAYQLFANH